MAGRIAGRGGHRGGSGRMAGRIAGRACFIGGRIIGVNIVVVDSEVPVAARLRVPVLLEADASPPVLLEADASPPVASGQMSS